MTNTKIKSFCPFWTCSWVN